MSLSSDDFQPNNLPRLLYRLFSSYWLATTVLVFMTLVTLFGTLYQVEAGLFAAKQKYFHSWFIWHRLGDGLPLSGDWKWLGTIKLPLPGGFLLMLLLTINLTIGAIVKVKKRLKGVGMLIAHFGMIFLLAGGFVTYAFNREGYMALYEGQSGARVESYHHWQLEVIPLSDSGEADKALTITPEQLQSIGDDESRKFTSADLPFDVEVTQYLVNAMPIPVSAPIAAQATGREINGYKLLRQDRSKEEAQNLPAALVTFRPKEAGGSPVETFISARSSNFDPREQPMSFGFEMAGKKFAARLVKETWPVPFAVRLDKFIFERHPGVSMARNYESRVTRIEDGHERALEIKMNEPMRHGGYTFFQESFGPADAGPGEAMYSQFAVHNNPADQWPLWSLGVTTVGLLTHFGIRLIGHLARPRRGAAAPSPLPPPDGGLKTV